MTEHDDAPPVPDRAFLPMRAPVTLAVGAFVQYGDAVYRIEQVLDFHSVIGVNVESGRSKHLRNADLRLPDDEERTKALDLDDIADDDWHTAQARYAAIKPFVGQVTVGRDRVEARAKEIGKDTATLYRWMELYRTRGRISDLVAKKSGWRSGKSRLTPQIERVIDKVIDEFYLTLHRPSAIKTVTEVKLHCRDLGIDAPSATAVRRRINRIPEKIRLNRRGYRDLARKRHNPAPGHFPNADYPLDVVQIDHTPVDIEVVDDVHRRPIGRPYITLALDVCTSMVTGYYLALDAPSAASVGLCIAHAALPKEEWLSLHGVEADWPVWGFPRTIHVDNGSDLRSNTISRSCLEHGIHLEYRPLGKPEAGGSVESGLGTLLEEIHSLPGTTFSSVHVKGEYDSGKHAAMTFAELEAYIVDWITTVYHCRLHSRDHMTALHKWKKGFLGDAETPPIPMPARPNDRLSIMLDFLPGEERTVQPNGVMIDGLTYYDEVLRDWIGVKDETTGKTRKFVFRRDPRDISEVYFLDPVVKQYFQIPSANLAFPALSLWEYNAARRALREEGKANFDESELLRAIARQRERVEKSKASTRKARRQGQRRKEHEKKTSPATPLSVQPPRAPAANEPMDDMVDGPVGTFEELA